MERFVQFFRRSTKDKRIFAVTKQNLSPEQRRFDLNEIVFVDAFSRIHRSNRNENHRQDSIEIEILDDRQRHFLRRDFLRSAVESNRSTVTQQIVCTKSR